MTMIRMKHLDPTCRASYLASGPDELGGYMVDEKSLVAARHHGWNVVHIHEEPWPTPTDDANAKTVFSQAAPGNVTGDDLPAGGKETTTAESDVAARSSTGKQRPRRSA